MFSSHCGESYIAHSVDTINVESESLSKTNDH